MNLDIRQKVAVLQANKAGRNKFRFVEDRGISCILNTHYPEHALRISDKTLLIGKRKYLPGDAEATITQQNMSNFFGIRAKILDLNEDGYRRKAFVILDCVRN